MDKMTITPLGTISPYAKGEMNCPGFLIEYKGDKILLDCGNGITRLLKFPDDLNNLHVFITHYHKDHFGDVGALQYASYVYHNLGLLEKEIDVFLPKNDHEHSRASIIENSESFARYIDIKAQSRFRIGDLEITLEDNASHTIESYMIKVSDGSKTIVYTSDIGTTNFDVLVDFCKGSDLLICESSFLRRHNSSSKTHMTAYDAGELAKRANVGKLLLTHFWPEEDKREYLSEAREVFKNTEVAVEGEKYLCKVKGLSF